VVLSLVNPGDEVIVPAPYWVSYLEIIKLAEGVPVILEAGIESDFKISPKQLSDAMNEKSKMIIFSSPCNPTGSVYTKEELQAYSKVIAKKKNFFVLSDEIYEHINFVGKHESIARFENIKEQVITVNGVSKGFAMTGWRMGDIGASKLIADACDKMKGQITSGTGRISQKAAMAAVEADHSVCDEMKDAFKRRRDLVLKQLAPIKGMKLNKPQGAFYVFPDISAFFNKAYGKYKISNATDLSLFLLDEANVAVVSGDAFGAKDCLRISYATSDDLLIEAIKRIKSALEKLK